MSGNRFPSRPCPSRSALSYWPAARRLELLRHIWAHAILAALASAIGNTAVIRLKHGWLEPSVLWVALVGWSGTLKSPVLDLALCPIRRRQATAIANFEAAWQAYETEKEQYGADLREWLRKGKSKGEPEPRPPEEPTCERFYVSDVTVEALAKRLQKTPRGLLLAREELAGWLGSFDLYKGGKGGSDSSHWLTMFGARDLLVDRKSEGQKPIFVPRAAVSIVGGIQPQVLQRALGREHFDDGMAARLLLTMPPTTQKHWTEATVDRTTEAAMESLFDFLYGYNQVRMRTASRSLRSWGYRRTGSGFGFDSTTNTPGNWPKP